MSIQSPPPAPSEALPLPNGNAQTTRNNPIALRLYKITSRTALDQPTQEALQILSERYCQPSVPSNGAEAGPSRTNGYWLSSDKDTEWDDNSDFSDEEDVSKPDEEANKRRAKRAMRSLLRDADPDAATRARKNFKKDVEGELAKGSMKFLKAFGKVDQASREIKLQVLRGYLDEMQNRCSSIQAELDNANKGTQTLLERAKGLQDQQVSTKMRAELSSLFLKHFTLTPEETDVLNSKDVTINERLFQAMDRVDKIRKDCAGLFLVAGVGNEGGLSVDGEAGRDQEGDGVEGRDPALAAKEIMSLASSQQDLAFDRIHRYCCFEFRKFSRDTHLEVAPALREAVLRLRVRDSLLDDAIAVLTDIRQASILQSFLDALTRGGPDGFPRPIELYAHDPTRYIGDMLAWVHQATAGENEFLDSLFDVDKGKRRMVGQTRDFGKGRSSGEAPIDPEEVEQQVRRNLSRSCLDKNLEGLSRPLKIRIRDTVESQEGVIMAYKIANLVQFYLVTMQRTIGEEAVLTVALAEIHDIAYKGFLGTLEAQGRSLLRFLHAPENNLAPPIALRESSHVLHEIMSVYDTSLVDDVDREADFAKILKAAADPLMEMCRQMIEMKRGSGQWEKDIFLINCSLYLQHVLKAYTFTSTRQKELQEQIGQWEESLLEQHYRNLLKQSGLAGVIDTLHAQQQAPADPAPLSRSPSADSRAITVAVKSLEGFLTSVDVLTSARLALLTSSRIATEIHRGALEKLARDYEKLHNAIMDKANKYEFPSTLMNRTPEEVYVLLGMEAPEQEA